MAKYKGSWLEFSDLRLRVHELEQEVEGMKLQKELLYTPDERAFLREREAATDTAPKSPNWDLAVSLVSHTIVPSGPDGHLVSFTISVKRIPE